jgi:hypothetical protein
MRARTKVALAAPVVAGLVGGLGLGTIYTATPAHAYTATGDTSGAFSGPAGDRDAGAMWTDVHSFLPGWSQTKDATLATTICYRLATGSSEGKITAEVANGDSSEVNAIQYVIHAAEWHYCPEYY